MTLSAESDNLLWLCLLHEIDVAGGQAKPRDRPTASRLRGPTTGSSGRLCRWFMGRKSHGASAVGEAWPLVAAMYRRGEST